MKRKFRQVIAMLAAFCIAFTGMPLIAGSLDAHAASKFTIKSAKAVSSSAVKLTWKKYKKSNAYVVYRNGELIKRLTKTSYTDEGLNASTKYTYKVKALKKYTKKQKQWFNKKTEKWQTKKPAKKYRGKSKTVKKVKYKTLGTSKAKTVKTRASVFDDTDLEQDVSGNTVKAYALASISVKVDYSDTENLKGTEEPGYTWQFRYNSNGLLKKSISNADPNKWGDQICGTESFSYTGGKVREMFKDTGSDLFPPEKIFYSYEGGKLKSSTRSYPTDEDDEPFTRNHKVSSKGRVDSTYYTVTMLGEKEYYETAYQYTDEGYLSRMAYSENNGQYEAFEYDGHGNAVQMIHHGRTSPMSSAVETIRNTAANKYTDDGRLSGTLISNYNGIKYEISLSYKEVSIPEEYQKAFAAQQHDIIFRYVYMHMYMDQSLLDLPLGLVG